MHGHPFVHSNAILKIVLERKRYDNAYGKWKYTALKSNEKYLRGENEIMQIQILK